MRHLMWILTWIALGIGGVLGAASVIVLSSGRKPPAQPEVIAGSGKSEPVLVDKPRSAAHGRSVIVARRHFRPVNPLD